MKAIKSIYAAGKISMGDWRCQYIDNIEDWKESGWDITKNAICGLDYTGPYFASNGGHGIGHGKNTHGVGAGAYGHEHCDDTIEGRTKIYDLCTQAIDQSDLFFAWIDCHDCYGTITEIGYAKGKRKQIWIAGPEKYPDLWFVYEMADLTAFHFSKPEEAIQEMFNNSRYERWTSDSPIEQTFWDEWMNRTWRNCIEFALEPQYAIGKYRVDFAQPETRTIIELDGHATHSSPTAIAKDRQRQRELEAMDWFVIRFGGKEIHDNPQKCVGEVWNILRKRWRQYYDKNIRNASPFFEIPE